MKQTFLHEDDLKSQLNNFIRKAERLSMGEECERFEEALSQYFDVENVVFVNSGSSANLLLLQSLINTGRLKPGDLVGFSAVTWATNVMPLIQLGLIPIPIDINVESLNISSESIKTALNEHKEIKCIFVTNLLGLCDDLGNIKTLCEEREIILIEDNCEGLGSEFEGTKLGKFGLAATHSTYVGHHLSTIEGGFVITNDHELGSMMKMARAHGWNRSLNKESKLKLKEKWQVSDFYDLYTFYELGYNFRPTEIAGFIGNHQIKYINEIVQKRQLNHNRFKVALSNSYLTPKISHMSEFSSFAFPIIAKDSNSFVIIKNKLEEAKIEIRPIVGGNITRQPFFKRNNLNNFDLPDSDMIHLNGLYIANRPDLCEEDIEYVTQVISSL
jgi:CDP-6-deoxy-D-xylo-4-hexulose-3-dehydrase